MIEFIIGLIIGELFGIITVSLCCAAKLSDNVNKEKEN